MYTYTIYIYIYIHIHSHYMYVVDINSLYMTEEMADHPPNGDCIAIGTTIPIGKSTIIEPWFP